MALLTFKKHSLKTRDDVRTKAAELTLRQSIYPICLVTTLFFLWVRYPPESLMARTIGLVDAPHPGFQLRPPRHPQQTLPKHPRHHQSPLIRPASSILRRLSSRLILARSRELDTPTIRLQSLLHLGSLLIRRRSPGGLAVHSVPDVWGILRRDIHNWERIGES